MVNESGRKNPVRGSERRYGMKIGHKSPSN